MICRYCAKEIPDGEARPHPMVYRDGKYRVDRLEFSHIKCHDKFNRLPFDVPEGRIRIEAHVKRVHYDGDMTIESREIGSATVKSTIVGLLSNNNDQRCRYYIDHIYADVPREWIHPKIHATESHINLKQANRLSAKSNSEPNSRALPPEIVP